MRLFSRQSISFCLIELSNLFNEIVCMCVFQYNAGEIKNYILLQPLRALKSKGQMYVSN